MKELVAIEVFQHFPAPFVVQSGIWPLSQSACEGHLVRWQRDLQLHSWSIRIVLTQGDNKSLSAATKLNSSC